MEREARREQEKLQNREKAEAEREIQLRAAALAKTRSLADEVISADRDEKEHVFQTTEHKLDETEHKTEHKTERKDHADKNKPHAESVSKAEDDAEKALAVLKAGDAYSQSASDSYVSSSGGQGMPPMPPQDFPPMPPVMPGPMPQEMPPMRESYSSSARDAIKEQDTVAEAEGDAANIMSKLGYGPAIPDEPTDTTPGEILVSEFQ